MDDQRIDREGGSLVPLRRYTAFDDLPNHIKSWLRTSPALSGENLEVFTAKAIPALDGKSILEVAGQIDGDKLIAEFCGRLSKFY